MSPSIISPDIILRDELKSSDRESVRSIVERTGFFRPEEVAVAVELVEDRLARGRASSYHFIFAERYGAAIGYACYGPIACTLASFDLYWIAIDPEYQRQGIGRLLLMAAEARIAAAGGKRIYVDTAGQPRYAPTRAFYERNGYRREATLRDFYAPGDDRIIYVRAV